MAQTRSNNSRLRLWSWTLFDPLLSDVTHFNSCVDRGDFTYWCGQCELCPDTNRKHIQGFLCLSQPRTLVGLKRCAFTGPRLNTVHLKASDGTADQNRVYCSKDTSIDPDGEFQFCEHGDFTAVPERNGQGTRNDLHSIARAVRDGASLRDIANDHPAEFVRNYRGLQMLQQTIFRGGRVYSERDVSLPTIRWFHGQTGSGKSRAAFTEAYAAHPDSVYVKPPGTRWWDGYLGQKCVILDDFRGDWFSFGYLLRLTDLYPLDVEVKGGYTPFCATDIYFTCPVKPEILFARLAEGDNGRMNQLLRRITETKLFGDEIQAGANAEGFNPYP